MHLRINYITAVRSISMFIIVILVIFFRNIKAIKWSYFCYNRIFVDSFVFKRSFRLLSNLFLFQIMIKNCKRYCVPTSLPCRLRVVGSCVRQKISSIFSKFITLDQIQSVLILHDRFPSAYLFIRRVFHLSSRISRKN